MDKPSWMRKYGNFLTLGLLLILAVIVLVPPLVVFLTSFAPTGTTQNALPRYSWSLSNYRDAWQRGKFLLVFANSTLVALAVTSCQIITSALAGYALAKLKLRGREILLGVKFTYRC